MVAGSGSGMLTAHALAAAPPSSMSTARVSHSERACGISTAGDPSAAMIIAGSAASQRIAWPSHNLPAPTCMDMRDISTAMVAISAPAHSSFLSPTMPYTVRMKDRAMAMLKGRLASSLAV